MVRRNWKLQFLVTFFYRVGQVFGFFRFKNCKNKNCVKRSKFLEIYSRVLWIAALIFYPIFVLAGTNASLKKTVTDVNGFVLFRAVGICVFIVNFLTYLSMSYFLFFGRLNLTDLVNEGFILYRTIRRFKFTTPSNDQIFWIIFIKIFLLEIPTAIVLLSQIFLRPSSTIFYLFTVFYRSVNSVFVDLLNAVFLYSSHLFKMMGSKILELKFKKKKFSAELGEISKFYLQIMKLVIKINELLSASLTGVYLCSYMEIVFIVSLIL